MLVKNLHIMNSIWAMILPGAISAYNLIIARTFIRENIPQELFEASVVDGCSDVRYYLSILLPLPKAVISVLLLFYAVGHCHCEDDISNTLQDSFGFRMIAWENFDACSHDVIDPRRLDKEPGDSKDYLALHGKLGYETKKAAGCAVHGEQASPAPLIFLCHRSHSWQSHDVDSRRAKAKA